MLQRGFIAAFIAAFILFYFTCAHIAVGLVQSFLLRLIVNDYQQFLTHTNRQNAFIGCTHPQ